MSSSPSTSTQPPHGATVALDGQTWTFIVVPEDSLTFPGFHHWSDLAWLRRIIPAGSLFGRKLLNAWQQDQAVGVVIPDPPKTAAVQPGLVLPWRCGEPEPLSWLPPGTALWIGHHPTSYSGPAMPERDALEVLAVLGVTDAVRKDVIQDPGGTLLSHSQWSGHRADGSVVTVVAALHHAAGVAPAPRPPHGARATDALGRTWYLVSDSDLTTFPHWVHAGGGDDDATGRSLSMSQASSEQGHELARLWAEQNAAVKP